MSSRSYNQIISHNNIATCMNDTYEYTIYMYNLRLTMSETM